LISIHGHSNCGKTYVGKRLHETATQRGFISCRGQSDDERSYFQNGPNPDYVFIEDYLFTETADYEAKRIVGKGVDIRVLVDNPKITGGLECYPFLTSEDIRNGLYDVIIDNPDSKLK